MSPQLTLQTPLELPPAEVIAYLEQLWSGDQSGGGGAPTFCLLVWQPSWVEQQLVRTGRLPGAITGVEREQLIEIARQVVVEAALPLSTPPLSSLVARAMFRLDGDVKAEDLRGQHIDASLSAQQPRRLITLAPTLDENQPLKTLVAAYCPLLEEKADSNACCGDVLVLCGGLQAIGDGLPIVRSLLPSELPSWMWWNGSLDESTDLFEQLGTFPRRLIIDSSQGNPSRCLKLLRDCINTGQAVNDLNWLRLGAWRETLAMVFDPPQRRESLSHVIQLDIDVEGRHFVQGLLLAAWITDRLGWDLHAAQMTESGGIEAKLQRPDSISVHIHIMPVPVGHPSIHAGQIVGVRLICKPSPDLGVCVIICAESSGCMRLEAGGVASMELIEEVVPQQHGTMSQDVARLLSGGQDSTSPLLSAAVQLAAKMLDPTF